MEKNTYKKLLSAHRDRVFSYALYFLRNQDDAEDVTQEAFLRLWRKGQDLDPEKAEAWLVRVTHNLCVDHTRRRRTVRNHLGTPDSRLLDQLPGSDDSWSDPEKGMRQAQMRQEILVAMDTLQDETRSIMLMHYFQGLRLQEIASTLGKKTSTVKVQVHRARKALRLVLEGRMDNHLAAKREIG